MTEERLRVLLIDDEQSLREPLAKYLRDRFNYHIDTAADARQAWQLISEAISPYDVALIDDMLVPQVGIEPQLIGIALMNRIREHHPGTECILFTGWGMDRARASDALRAGAYRYFAKPIEVEELGITIRLAAERGRLKQRLESTRQEKKLLQTFIEIGRATTSVLELDKVLEHIWEQINRLLDASCMDVILYDSSNRMLKFELGYDKGIKEEKWERPFTPGHGLTDWVIQHRRPLLIRDYQEQTPPVLPSQRGKMSRSWLGVPLIARDQVIGAITVQSYASHQFDETDQQILETVTSHVAGAIQNAQLFSELIKTQKWREALINHTLDAVVAIDQEKRVTVFNRRAEKLFGWQAKEIIGQPVPRLYMSVRKAKEIFDTVDHEGGISSLEVELKHRNGTPIPARLSVTQIKDNNGHPIGQAQFMRDLRQVNLLEERLRALIWGNRVINSSLELEQVLNQILQAALEAFPMARGGVIHLYDEKTGILRLQANTFNYSPSAIQVQHLKPGEGIAGWVYIHGQPVVVPDARQDERYKLIDHPEIAPHRPMVCVPLKVRDQVLGTLSLNTAETFNTFQAEELGLLSTFADQAAIAIDNARFFREQKRRQQLLTRLDESSRHIRAEKPIPKLLHEIVRQAVELINCSAGALFLNRPHIRELELQVAYELPAKIVGSRLTHAEGIIGLVARTGKSKFIRDYSTWSSPAALFESCHLQSVAGIPLKQADEVQAVLMVADQTDCLGHLQLSDLEILERLAAQAAISYNNARRIQELEHLRWAAETVAGASSVPAVLKQIAKSAIIVLNAECSIIWPYDQERRIFLPTELETAGISPELVEQFRDVEPQPEGTTETVLHLGWLGVPDVDQRIHPFLGSPSRGLRGAITVRSFQGVALRVGDEILGVLYADYERPRSFNQEDRKLAETFATHASLALKKARLLDQISKARDTAKAVAEVSILEKLESTLDSIVQGTFKALNCDAVTLYTYNQHKDQIEFPPAMIGVQNSHKVLSPGFIARDSVVGRILDLGQVHVAEDAPSDPIIGGGFVEREGVKSSVSIPLQVGDQKVGVMFVNYRTLHRFTEEELSNIKLFATQAAIAIRNARLIDDVFHRNIQLQTVAQVSKSTSTLLAPKELMHQAVNLIRERFKLYYVGLFLIDENSKHAVLRASSGDAGQEMLQAGYKLAIDASSMIGWSIDNAQPRIVLDISKEKIRLNNPYLPETRSELTLPLISRGRCIGALTVQSTESEAFSTEDVAVLQTTADQLAIAIENAQLYREETERLQESLALQKVAMALAGTLELGEVLNHMMQAAMDFTDTCSGTILLWDLRQKEFIHSLTTGPERTLQFYSSRVREEGIARTIVERKRTIVISDAENDSRISPIAIEKRRRAFIGTPLVSREEAIGVLYVSRSEPRQFSKRQVALLESLASQAAVAIERARQYRKLQLAYSELTKLDERKSEFLSTVSHELRSPLTPIKSCIELMLNGTYGSIPDKQRTRLEMALASVNDEARLVGNLLDLVRIQENRVTLDLERGNVLDVVRSAVQVFEYDAGKKHIELQTNLSTKGTFRTFLDKGKVKQIVTNLISNAINFTPENGVIVVSISSDKEWITVQVKDNGIGVPEEEQEKIFDRFYQVDSSSTRKVGGTGIGLNIVKEYVEMHGGQVWVQSEEGKGSTFTFTLPKKEERKDND